MIGKELSETLRPGGPVRPSSSLLLLCSSFSMHDYIAYDNRFAMRNRYLIKFHNIVYLMSSDGDKSILEGFEWN
jgi:hypothetical protein